QPSRTMRIAQRLYEGVELGAEGAVGLITYMRTDSTRISGEAIAAVRDYIPQRFGPDYLPADPNVYRSKKDAQDAHEAIRPTSMGWDPEKVAPHLEREELALYTLISNRFVGTPWPVSASVAVPFATVPSPCGSRPTGWALKFAGFAGVYAGGPASRSPADDEDAEGQLPALTEGEVVQLRELVPEQHFTQP